jgi:hypothetical protein
LVESPWMKVMARKKFSPWWRRHYQEIKKSGSWSQHSCRQNDRKLVEDDLKKCRTCERGINPLPRPNPLDPHAWSLGLYGMENGKWGSFFYKSSSLSGTNLHTIADRGFWPPKRWWFPTSWRK